MPVGLLGRKVGMTQIYDGDGNLVTATVVEAGPCVVLQLRTHDRDGYEAVQLGFEDKPRRLSRRSERGHVANLKGKRQERRSRAGVKLPPKPDHCEPKRFIREFRTDGEDHGCQVGQQVTVEIFTTDEVVKDKHGNVVYKDKDKKQAIPTPVYVDVIGRSKGRGTAGVMKRHNFSGQRASHGVKRVHRHAGSIGMSADPARVLKGTRMPGRYGNSRITMRHLRVVRVDEENNMLLVRGSVPGPNGGFVVVRHTNKRG